MFFFDATSYRMYCCNNPGFSGQDNFYVELSGVKISICERSMEWCGLNNDELIPEIDYVVSSQYITERAAPNTHACNTDNDRHLSMFCLHRGTKGAPPCRSISMRGRGYRPKLHESKDGVVVTARKGRQSITTPHRGTPNRCTHIEKPARPVNVLVRRAVFMPGTQLAWNR